VLTIVDLDLVLEQIVGSLSLGVLEGGEARVEGGPPLDLE